MKPKSVLIIGSGPIVIGQAAEFDYAGTQACKAVREEGVRSILVNSNSATIMTDLDIADAVYIEPLTVPVIERIIQREKPEAILPTLGGQTGLNLAVALSEAGVIEKYGLRLLGTPLTASTRPPRNGPTRRQSRCPKADESTVAAVAMLALARRMQSRGRQGIAIPRGLWVGRL